MRYTLVLFACLSLLPCTAAAQWEEPEDILRTKIGLVGGMNFSWHQGTYMTSDAQFDCCSFTGGNGLGRSAGLRMVIPVTTEFSLRPGLMFEQFNGEYPAEYESYPVLGRDNQVLLLSLEERFAVTLETFSVEMLLTYDVLTPGVYVTLGPSYSILMSKHQEQREIILSPAEIEFTDGGRSHILIDSEIPDAGNFFSFRAGAGALFVLSSLLYANPEILFTIPLNDVRERGEWSVSGFEVTLGVLLVL
ncbi:MAG: outer membrane beta-barrel protein [Bacteroidetes bacterium]|nr:outer membrane beta-barrel protein [Bacteroidota bacterium]